MEHKRDRHNDPSFINSIYHYNKHHEPNQECKKSRKNTGELDDTFINDINNLGLDSLNVRNTRFVISTTASVPEHEFSEDSEEDSLDEEVDEKFNRTFNQNDCVEGVFPFTPTTKTTTKVKTKEIILEKELAPLNLRTNSQIVGAFLSKVLQNGFDEHEKDNKISTIAVCVGLNRMYSLSSRKNKSLNIELQSVVNAQNISYETFGFYWRCKWNDNDGKEAEFEDVRSFYKKLKKADPLLAKQFLQKEQIFAKNRENIPYQDIRDYAKNHAKTKKLITEFREDNSNAVVYLSLIDADVLNFNGVYSAYLRIVDGCHVIPTIMTTGYEYPDESRAFELFSHMDRMIRVITTFYIPLGTYYPEPNVCILVPPDYDTVPERFIDRKRGNGKTLESPILLTDIKNKRGSELRAIFSEDSPIIVTVPQRAKSNKKSKRPIPFSSEFMQGSANPSKSDIKSFDQVSQSHSDNFTWLGGLFINKAIEYEKNYETDVEKCDLNTIDLPKGIYRQCKRLITKMKYNDDADSVEQLKSILACRIGTDNANNIAEALIAIKNYNEHFYKTHARTPEEEELINIMKKRSADFVKLPKGFLLKIATSPIMLLIKNNTVDVAILCKQETEVLERFVDDHNISMALEKKLATFEEFMACLTNENIDFSDDPLSAFLLYVNDPLDIVNFYAEMVRYTLKNGYINDDGLQEIGVRLLGDRQESAAEHEPQMYLIEARKGDDDGDDYFYRYNDPSGPCGMYATVNKITIEGLCGIAV